MVANTAITLAQSEIEKAATTTEQVIVPVVNLGSITNQPIQVMLEESNADLVISLSSIGKKDSENNLPFGSYTINASVLDDKGNRMEMVDITMDAPDNLLSKETRKTNTQSGMNSKDWYTAFGYIPTKAGNKVITFTSGSFVNTFEINVE